VAKPVTQKAQMASPLPLPLSFEWQKSPLPTGSGQKSHIAFSECLPSFLEGYHFGLFPVNVHFNDFSLALFPKCKPIPKKKAEDLENALENE